MSLVGLMGRLAASGPGGLDVNVSRCTHTLDHASTCNLCVTGCPVGAIHLSPRVTLDQATCVGCGLCLHVCPTEVFQGDDGVTQLLNCAGRLDNAPIIELACARHPQADSGPYPDAVALRTTGCLAALGPSAYVGLLAQGAERLIVRLDACDTCPIGAARPRIESAVAVAQALGPAGVGDGWLATTGEPPLPGSKRPIYDVANPPVSRRSLFRLFSRETSRLAAQTLLPDEPPTAASPAPPRERRRLIQALRRLTGQVAGEQPLAGSGFVSLIASSACTACGVCARACPTGALAFSQDGLAFALRFRPGACTDCGICLDVCEPGALARTAPPTVAEALSAEPLTLRAGAIQKCARCGAHFAATEGQKLCPVCEFRRQNPFGSRMPGQRKTAANQENSTHSTSH